MKKTPLVSKEDIEAWKKKHGEIYEITVDDATGYIRRPDRKMMSHALTGSNSGKDGIKFNEILLRDIWLGGDERILDDDDYFMGASGKLDELMNVKEASLKKL